MKTVMVYITAGNEDEAITIGEALVKERLVACVNILGKINSIYWWEGAVQKDSEVALIAKTKNSLLDKLMARVKELHSYECPCIVSWELGKGNPSFYQWINDQVG